MASESPDGGTLSEPLPDGLVQWLDEQAEERGMTRTALLEQLVGAYRVATESDVSLAETDDVEAIVTRIVEQQSIATDDDLSSLEADLESNLESNLEDIRRRVVQVKNAADEKAPADHSHSELGEVEQLSTRIEELTDAVAGLRETVEAHDETVEAAEDTVDDLDEKLTRVAHAVVQLRSTGSDEEQLNALKHEAALEGIERANCGACGETVSVALLTDAACPHCDVQVRGVEPGRGFFGKPHLTGERTAEQTSAETDE